MRTECEEAGMERWRDGQIEKWMLTNSGCHGDWVHYFSFEVPSVRAKYSATGIRPSTES